MMIQDRYKLIHYLGYPGYENQFELYDLQNDPEEMEDLFEAKPEIAREMRNILEEKIKEVDSPYLKKS
jgi:arylsulfatase A-like enzyme